MITQHRYRLITLGLVAAAMAQLAFLALRGGPLDSRLEYLALESTLAAFGLATGLLPRLVGAIGDALAGAGARMQRGAWLGWLALLALLPLGVLGGAGRFFEPIGIRLVTLWLLALAGAALVQKEAWERSFDFRLGASLLAGGAIYLASTYLTGISSYPLSLGWSEASRYYYASLFASERLYGIRVPPSVLHPSRYLLQAIPFLIPNSGIWLHRLWNLLLWLGLPLATAGLLVRRLDLQDRTLRQVGVLWVVLFLFQGPLLFHLLVPVILVFAGFRHGNFWRSLVAVVAASAWAGISRINWLAVPGFIAATLYFLERSRGDEPLVRYWGRPLLWVGVGSLAAGLSYSGYVLLSGNESEQFGSSLTSDLLAYRLLPNRTFPLGILGAVGLASLPILLMVWRWITGGSRSLSADRWIPVDGMLGVLLVGGVIVSLKIGGGSNLHNLDAYLILLLVLGAHVYFGRAASSDPARAGLRWGEHALLVGVPLFFVLSTGSRAPSLDREVGSGVVAQIQEQIDALESPEPRVLFISERQLLTFRGLDELELVPDYEKVFLMEMAMSGTRSYLDRFHSALREHRFDLIVSEPLKIQVQGRSHAFGEENDAWVREVSEPALCFYEPVLTIEAAAVQVLVPRSPEAPCQ
ncbi:MAG: hypothetical protein ACRDHG_08005 [Anaerolineales bacterium]